MHAHYIGLRVCMHLDVFVYLYVVLCVHKNVQKQTQTFMHLLAKYFPCLDAIVSRDGSSILVLVLKSA